MPRFWTLANVQRLKGQLSRVCPCVLLTGGCLISKRELCSVGRHDWALVVGFPEGWALVVGFPEDWALVTGKTSVGFPGTQLGLTENCAN